MAQQPRDSVIAVVGDGFGSLQVFTTAVYLGFDPEQIAIFGAGDDPVGTYGQFAHNLGQTVLRSESESHFLPADWPTFAQLDAWSRKSIRPLLRSIRRRYNPGVAEILNEATAVARSLGWNRSRVPSRIGWLQRETGDVPHLSLYDEDANLVGRAKHVMLALGHGPLNFPPALARARENPDLAPRIVQAYEPKAYAPGGRYIVIGAGIAAVNEWANALDAGGQVISLLRGSTPEDQDLNTPRCLFEALGIDIYQGLSFDERMAFLGRILKGTAPRRRSWEAKIELGRKQRRFEELQGQIDRVESGGAGLRVHIAGPGDQDLGWFDVTGVVCCTGFNKSALAVPLVRRLIEHYQLQVDHGRLKLRTNCGLPGLDMAESRVCAMGLLANSVVPHGDTIAGLKYGARRFVADCANAERLKTRGFLSRLQIQLSLASAASQAIKRLRKTEQLS